MRRSYPIHSNCWQPFVIFMTRVFGQDKVGIRRSFAAAAQTYDGMAELQRRMAVELLQRFPPANQPGLLLDIGCGTGFLTSQLSKAAPQADLLALDLALPMLQVSRSNYPAMDAEYLCADAEQLPLAAQRIEQIYSNLALQWVQDLPVTLAGFKRVLKPGGNLCFATFGPETLRELKAAWAAVDDYAHVNDFLSADQINSALQAAGFAEIGIDSVLYQSSYPSVQALMRELKAIGAHNVNRGRKHRPTTKSQLQSMVEQYLALMSGSRVVASYQIIFVKARV